jgi:hypothetical protein
MKRIMTALAVAAISASLPMFAAPGTALAAPAGTIYNSIPSPLPGNLPSLGYEATSTTEFGNQIAFSGTSRALDNVVVTLSSWACQSGSATDGTCVTAPGATFPVPITLNIYNPPTTGLGGTYPAPGSLIATDTQTFKIPYRPTADPLCGTNGGGWSFPNCFHGYANNITFNSFTPAVVTLPNNIVYGIAFNTSDYGATPQRPQACNSTSTGCPYDSLNVALSQDPTDISAGSNLNPGTVFWNTSYAPFYCDGGAAGFGFFRLDSPTSACWGGLVPAVQFNALTLTGPPTSKDQCKDGGWMAFNNPSFKNQGDCVSYVATGGTH